MDWKPAAGWEAEQDLIAPGKAGFDNNGFNGLFVTESAQGGTKHPKYEPPEGKKFYNG